MPAALRPFLSRLLASLIAGACTWLGVKYGVTLDAATQKDLVEIIVGVIMSYMTVYVTTHRVLDKSINPADTASSHLAAIGKAESKAIKARQRPNR